MAIVGLISVLVLRHVGTNEALSQARDITRLVGNGIGEPNITPGVVRGDPRALARFDRLVRRRVLQSPIVRVKLWRASGRLIYSDARQLIGQRYPLAPDDRYERGQGKLLQVYLGITGPGGVPLLFEAYQKYSSVTSSGQDLWLAFA